MTDPRLTQRLSAISLCSALVLSGCGGTGLQLTPLPAVPVITPTTSAAVIKHVVVIYGDGVSFDHYFGTYPNASNQPNDASVFHPVPNTPHPRNLVYQGLTGNNPNLNIANGSGASSPFRLDHAQAATAAQLDTYTGLQSAFNDFGMDLFPLKAGRGESIDLATRTSAPKVTTTTGLTMGYYDGNAVTALWNYAQHYTLGDHFHATTFGPTTVGAINLVSGQTNGVVVSSPSSSITVADGSGGFSLIGNASPTGDLCSIGAITATMSGKNIGDLLNAANVTWGSFQAGFDLSATNPDGSTGCTRASTSTYTKVSSLDYSPGADAFQFYPTTANPQHLRPATLTAIGTTDSANHQYDMSDFTASLAAGSLPAVSFLRAPGAQNGNAGTSSPLDEQAFLVNTINAIESSALWPNTAIVIAYTNSGGWYDHSAYMTNGSNTTADVLRGTNNCQSATTSPQEALAGVNPTTLHAQGRCGYGARLPILVVSPWAKANALDTNDLDQTSVLRFIEDTFLASQRIGNGSFDGIASSLDNAFDFSNGAVVPNSSVVLLDPKTGLVTSTK